MNYGIEVLKEIRRNLYEIDLFTLKIKEINKNLLELGKNLLELEKYYDYDDINYKEIKDVKRLY